ncbi:MAG: acylphosphatase [Candidatus Omnitrophota bacterium]
MIFTGRVQGVGFRFTTQRLAHDTGLSGWVKNLPDESVELWVQGDAARIAELVEKLKSYFIIYDVHVSQGAIMAMGDTFEIRY